MGVDIDVAVIGCGGAGLAAAIVSRTLGREVVVFEASDQVGGTFAYSTGLTWAPGARKAAEGGYGDNIEAAILHVDHLGAGHNDETITQAFMESVGPAVDDLADAGVPYDVVPGYPDYYAESPGGTMSGRYLASPVFDTSTLPDDWSRALVRSPIYERIPTSWPELQAWGGYGTIDRWNHDLLAQRREDGWVGFGTATAGYLLRAALEHGATIHRTHRLVELSRADDGWSLGFETESGLVRTAARHVILASGAYDWNRRMQEMLDPHPPATPAGMPTIDGEAITLALEAGASFAPVSGEILAPALSIPGEQFNGHPLRRLFVREPAFPGGLIVNGAGRRFADESFYRDVVSGMNRLDAKTQQYPNRDAYFVFDQAWKDKYWLGSVEPGAVPDWLLGADSPAELASELGLDATVFASTMKRYNIHAARGEDPEFHRGTMAYGRNNGDQDVSPNPCLRPLTGRLYALRLELTTLGGRGGLRFDEHARVLDWRDRPLPGLYCTGNTGAALVEGYWYNSGIANARAMAFSWLAAHHIARS